MHYAVLQMLTVLVTAASGRIVSTSFRSKSFQTCCFLSLYLIAAWLYEKLIVCVLLC
jgi:hypothetical protein